MIFGEAAHGDVADWRLATQGSIEAIEAQILPCPKIEAVPCLGPSLFRRSLDLNEGCFVRIFSGEIRQPIVIAFLRQPPAEGAAEFFAAPSTNSTLICDSFCPHQSTADKTSR